MLSVQRKTSTNSNYVPGSLASAAARIMRFAVADSVGQASIKRARPGSWK